jgi:hypothetical protein
MGLYGEMLEFFLHDRCLVHEGEVAKLLDGTVVIVPTVASFLNKHKASKPFNDFPMQQALLALQRSGRRPEEARFKYLSDRDCRRPIILMQGANAELTLIDGACRILRAQELGASTVCAYLVSEPVVSNATVSAGNCSTSDNSMIETAAALARITRSSFTQSGTLVQTRPDVNSLETAIGPIKTPAGDVASDRLYLTSAYVETKIERSFEKRGHSSAEIAIGKAIARLTQLLLTLGREVDIKFEHRNYLANLPFGSIDTELRSRTPDEKSRRDDLSKRFPGMESLPSPRAILKLISELQENATPLISDLFGFDPRAGQFESMTPV